VVSTQSTTRCTNQVFFFFFFFEGDIYYLGLYRSQWAKGSEVIYTLHQERYTTRKDGKSLLRTNTTRPSKCDRTANTTGCKCEEDSSGWGKREAVCSSNRKEGEVAKLEVRNRDQ
jgi:hypothetical protein